MQNVVVHIKLQINQLVFSGDIFDDFQQLKNGKISCENPYLSMYEKLNVILFQKHFDPIVSTA